LPRRDGKPKCSSSRHREAGGACCRFQEDTTTKGRPTRPTETPRRFELATRQTSEGQPHRSRALQRGRRFQPGSGITLKIPGLETAATFAPQAAPINQMARYKLARAPVVVIDTARASAGRSGSISTSTVKPEKANVEVIRPSMSPQGTAKSCVRNLKNAQRGTPEGPAGFRSTATKSPHPEKP